MALFAKEMSLSSREAPGITGKFGLGMRNEAGQRLIGFAKKMH